METIMKTQTTAFKMPYQEKNTQKFISFNKKYLNGERQNKRSIFERLLAEDRQTQRVAVRGYD